MRVIRVRALQPDTSFGVVVAAVVLLIVIALGWLVWWTLIIILCIPPIVNQITVGRTTKTEITIEKR